MFESLLKAAVGVVAALGELWFTCGKFWDGDDSIERLLRQVKTKEQDNV